MSVRDSSEFTDKLDITIFKNGINKLMKKLNSFDSRKQCLKFVVDSEQVGLILPVVASALKNFPEDFLLENDRVVLNPSHQTFEERTKVVEKVLLALKANSEFDQLQGWRNEHYFVRSRFSEMPKFSLERAGASLFGIKCYGCHINGYIKKNNEYFMWIARRSFTKPTYPGMLDNFVAGGLTAGLGVVECAIKELEEEAGVSNEIAKKLKSVNAISYAYEKQNGINNEGEFVFDLKLPVDYVPSNQDGEVECFYLMNINQVKNAIIREDFKPNSAVVTLNFLLRKGLLTPDELSNYFEILELMHVPGL